MGDYEKKYQKYFDLYESKSSKAKAGKSVNEFDLAALGAQLEQFEHWTSFKEANGSADDLGLLPRIGLDVIAASAATSVMPLIASIQPIQEKKGLVWFKNVKSETTRGNVTQGQTLLDAKQGRVGLPEQFAGEHITDDAVAKGDGSTTEFEGVIKYPEARVRTILVSVDGQSGTKLLDDGQGNLIGVGGKGSINYKTGAVSFVFETAPEDGAVINVEYSTNLETLQELQTVSTEYDSTEITARTFGLRAEIGLFKSYEMSKRFNIDSEEVLAKDLVGELTTNISTAGIVELYTNTKGTLTWDKKAPTGVSYMEHLLSFQATIAEAENAILEQSGRIGGDIVYVVGTSVAGLIRSLPGFVPATDVKASLGTHLYGTLDGRPVVRSIVMPKGEMLLVTKDDDFFTSPLVISPYMPLFVTDTFQGMDHNPLASQKAAASMTGIKSVVPTLATKVRIENI